jgi:hypothetical protein
MSEAGSLCEFPVPAKNPLKLPGRYQDRAPAPLMAADGWIGEWRLFLTNGKR